MMLFNIQQRNRLTRIQAYLFDHDERFFPGWKLDVSWILCTISWGLLALTSTCIGAATYVLPSEGGYELIPGEQLVITVSTEYSNAFLSSTMTAVQRFWIRTYLERHGALSMISHGAPRLLAYGGIYQTNLMTHVSNIIFITVLAWIGIQGHSQHTKSWIMMYVVSQEESSAEGIHYCVIVITSL